jgi:1,4-dihydroxy-2-naphthoyl-CoA hydrolase
MRMPTGPEGLDKLLGFDYVEVGPDRVEIRFQIRPELHQPFGILHGGVHCAVVESAASWGAALWYGEAGKVVGVANHTNFLRAASDGTLTAVATPIQRGRTQQLWLVEVSDEDGRAIARGEVRLANLPANR